MAETVTVEDKVIAAFSEIFGREDITPSTDIARDLAADSLERVALANALEAQFGTEMNQDVAASMCTVADAIAYFKAIEANA